MIRITLENLMARKLRLVSTAVAVVIGVAFLAGTLVLTDTIQRAFDDLFAEVNEHVDAQIRNADVIETDFGDIRGRIDASLLDEVVASPSVAVADGSVLGFAQLVDPLGEALGNPGQGAPTLGFAWSDVDELNPMNLLPGGRPPQGPDEIVIDAKSAKDGPFQVGDDITVLLQGPPRQFTLVGVARFGSVDSPLGASVTLFERETAQALLGEPGKFDSIDVVGVAGVSQAALRDELAAIVPGDIEVITGDALIEETQNDVADALSFINTFFTVFAGIALFVASFIIYNTFSILVSQRTREMALLRALGARRRQILGGVVLESLIVGTGASLLGLAAAVPLATGLNGLLAAVGFDIPTAGIVMNANTVVWSLVVGVVVTLVAAVMPSWRASRIAPMAAIRSASIDGRGHSRLRLAVGVFVFATGAALLFWGLFGNPSEVVAVIGGGVVLVFIGVTWLAPLLVVPFGRVVGAPLARLSVPGELAQENTIRNPRRTSTTAAALMIGVGLVGTIAIFASSAKASIAKIIDDSFVGDLVVDSETFGFGGLSPDLAARLNELPEVEAASGVRLGFAEIGGDTETLFGIDPATMGQIVDVGVLEGRVEDMGVDDIAVHVDYAEDRGWEVGDTVDVVFAATGQQRLTLSLLYDKDELTGNFFIGNPAFEANYPDVFDFQVYVLRADGVAVADALAAVEAVAADFANAEVQDLEEFKAAQAGQVDQLLNFIFVLLALAVIIALIGIANTLALSILERTHELGLLRAVGMTRRQLRASVRWESVLIAMLGTALGATVGLFFGWAMVRALESEGFTEFRLPTGQLITFVVIAVIAGVLAAALPARRAAKLDVLEAIAAEG